MQSFLEFLVSCFRNKSLSYKRVTTTLQQFSMFLSPNKYLRSFPRYYDRGLMDVIVYYFQVGNQKKYIIINGVISCHMGPIFFETPYIYIYHHHHHIVLAARISLTLSRHSSLSFIALGRSSGQQPVSSHSCWMYVRAGRPAFARPCVGIHKSTSLMSSSLLLQQCPACLVRLTWIVFVIGGRWPYSWCLVGCCCQDFSGLHAAFLCKEAASNQPKRTSKRG